MKSEKVLLLTGATGMIGGLLVRAVMEKKLFSQIVLPVRNIPKAKNMYSDLNESDYRKLHFLETRIEDICVEQFPMIIDSIIHCACITQSLEMIIHPVETCDSIVIGTKNILELAKKKKVKSMVYLSSMEVYGRVEDTKEYIDEENLGELDLQLVRSCYPMSKRMAEHYCHIYQREYGVPVKVARLAQLFGKGIKLDDNRVYMQFALAVCEGRDIVLKTNGHSMGNYCASDEAADAILFMLDKGVDGEVYNVVNESNTMQIYDMAQLVASQLSGNRIKVKVELEDLSETGYAQDTALRMSGKKLRKLGWQPAKGLVQMYQDVMEELAKLSCSRSNL